MIATVSRELAISARVRLLRDRARPRTVVITLASSLLVLSVVSTAQSQNVRSDLCQADGPVNAMVASGNTLYVGGAFTHLGTVVGPGAPIDAVTGQVVRPFPVVDGAVTLVAPDGAGGWYIGGSFTSVGGLPRSRLAHINADNTVADWNPTAGTNSSTFSGAG
jgi:hypothetical protein